MTYRQNIFQLWKFAVSGAVALSIFYGLLYSLTEYLLVNYILSATVGGIAAHFANFIGQKYWVFKNKKKQKIKKQFVLFTIVKGILFGANLGLLYFLVEEYEVYYLTAQVLLTIVLSTASFLLMRKIFTPKNPA